MSFSKTLPSELKGPFSINSFVLNCIRFGREYLRFLAVCLQIVEILQSKADIILSKINLFSLRVGAYIL